MGLSPATSSPPLLHQFTSISWHSVRPAANPHLRYSRTQGLPRSTMSHSRFNSPRLALSLIAAILLAPPLLAQDFSHPDTEPAPQNALIQKANDALAAGDFPAALKILTDLNTQTPKNAQVLYDLGMTLEALEADPAKSQQRTAATQLTAEA